MRCLLASVLFGTVFAIGHQDPQRNLTARDPSHNKHGKTSVQGLGDHAMLSHLLAKYDKWTRPGAYVHDSTALSGKLEDGAPTVVNVSIYIRDFTLDDAKMELHTTLTMRLTWTDERLVHPANPRHPYLFVQENHPKLWIPDIFFNNEKNAHFHHVLTPNVLYRVYPSGTVYMSTKISLTSTCPMTFTWFPLDHQTCRINLGSYGYTADQVDLQWNGTMPITVAHFQNTQGRFELKNTSFTREVLSTHNENFTMLTVNIAFARMVPPYIVHYYVPTAMLVALSWLAFWMHPDMLTPRVLLGLAALLTIYQLQTEGKSEALRVSYGNAYGFWGQLCALFAAFSLIVSVIANYWNRRDVMCYKTVNNMDTMIYTPMATPLLAGSSYSVKKEVITRGDRLDAICRVMFPLLYLCSIIAYWAVCFMT
ncbi:hypothetical protein RvY_00456 [Ramazzottius varieornatus]|uniref:Uncharacterized protein n=1 Tax=Ramazzottius varieornatus TaxID=947166 RepID=A0A1D1UGI0_RAMVA|nr:hypothetical protein RvY_00456 [Ramazzottius varieornatus]